MEISSSVIDALVGYARSELPNEACGYLVGDADGCVSRFVPITNAAASPTRFMFDPLEQLAAEQAIETAGDTVVGVAHSHPTGAATPSTTDVDDAGRYDPCGVFLHAIVEPGSGMVRWFRISGGEVESVTPVVSPIRGSRPSGFA